MRSSAQNRFTAVGRLAASVLKAIPLLMRLERDAESRGAADGRRTAHDHGPDRLGNFGRVRAAQVFEAIGEGALVDQFEPRPSPAQGLDGYRFR